MLIYRVRPQEEYKNNNKKKVLHSFLLPKDLFPLPAVALYVPSRERERDEFPLFMHTQSGERERESAREGKGR